MQEKNWKSNTYLSGLSDTYLSGLSDTYLSGLLDILNRLIQLPQRAIVIGTEFRPEIFSTDTVCTSSNFSRSRRS